VIVAVGLFAVGEALHMAAKLRTEGEEELVRPSAEAEADRARWLSRDDARRS